MLFSCISGKHAVVQVVYGKHVFPECSSAAPSAGKEWEEYIQIRGLVEKIRKKQKGKCMCKHTIFFLFFY